VRGIKLVVDWHSSAHGACVSITHQESSVTCSSAGPAHIKPTKRAVPNTPSLRTRILALPPAARASFDSTRRFERASLVTDAPAAATKWSVGDTTWFAGSRSGECIRLRARRYVGSISRLILRAETCVMEEPGLQLLDIVAFFCCLFALATHKNAANKTSVSLQPVRT